MQKALYYKLSLLHVNNQNTLQPNSDQVRAIIATDVVRIEATFALVASSRQLFMDK